MTDDKSIEEVKPDFFIKTYTKGDKVKYRRVYPLKWKGQSRWGKEIKGIFSFRTFFTIALILFLGYSYHHDTFALQQYYKLTQENRTEFCASVGRIELPDCNYTGELNPDTLYKCYSNVGFDLTNVIPNEDS